MEKPENSSDGDNETNPDESDDHSASSVQAADREADTGLSTPSIEQAAKAVVSESSGDTASSLVERARSPEARDTLQAVEQARSGPIHELLGRQDADETLAERTGLRIVNTGDLDSKEARNTAYAVLANMAAEGHLDEVETFHARISDETRNRYRSEPIAAFDHSRGAVEMGTDPYEQENYDQLGEDLPDGVSGLANPTREHAIRHEIGHAAHEDSIGYRRITEQYDQEFKDVVGDDVDDIDQFRMTIAKELSGYAAQSPTEFVAEAFAAQVGGEDLSPELQDLYNKLGGPQV